MKISQNIRDFGGFAILAILGICGLGICYWRTNCAVALLIWFAPFCAAGALLLVGILGMILSLVEEVIARVVAWRSRFRAFKRES